jgi:hypothetical protein
MGPAQNSISPECDTNDKLAAAKRWFVLFSTYTDLCMGFLPVLLMTLLLAQGSLSAQTSVTTWHYDNQRTSANTTEFLLTPSNVNVQTFGKLFSLPVDGFIVGHALYLPGVNISGNVHNVVYVATMHDTVYAFDADTPGAPLWVTSILTYSPPGATSVPATVQKNGGVTGWVEVGIISTPVIDPNSGTLYLVAETYENGNVVHRLHALDVITGQEKLGGPTTIAAAYTLNGVTSTFQGTYQINRPALLLVNGHIYVAFGSNCCNAYSQGWVMSYNASTLQQEGAFDVEPGKTLASIWQKGAGLSADSDGNIYGETGEGFYAPGTNLAESVLKLSQVGTTLALSDWFTPFNYPYLSDNDLDMAEGVLILPDQPLPIQHEAIAVGKEGTIYVLNRDNMGHLCSTCTTSDTQIVQELPDAVGYESGTPVYWNNTVYFTGENRPVMAYGLSNGMLTVSPIAQSTKIASGAHALITANGNSNGILWYLGPGALWALDAQTLRPLYSSSTATNGRDQIPAHAHFATPIAADGKVFVGTQSSLVVFGLLPTLSPVGGNQQSGAIGSTLPVALKVQAMDSYTQNVRAGVTVTFSDGGKGGAFNPSSAVTDATGFASSFYTLPATAGSYKVTASANGYASASFTEIAISNLADLVDTNVTNPPATATNGSSFSVTDTVQSNGNVAAPATTTRYFLSTTTTKSGARLLNGNRAVPSLSPGATSTGSVTVTVGAGTPAGTYFLLACADDTNLVSEALETNNCKASTTKVTVGGPDLVETAVSNPPTTTSTGGTFSVTDTAQNVGGVTAAASNTRYYLSTTTSKGGARLMTGSRAVTSLTSGATSSGTVTVTVSANTAAGTYFLLACADDTLLVPEMIESNNCKASATQITVGGADLLETAVSDPPMTVSGGTSFSVTDTGQNAGNGTAAASRTRYFLSTTSSKTLSSILLAGNRSVPSLAPGATSSGSATVTVPSTLPSGTYFLLACQDDTHIVAETNETNNCKASTATTTH